MSFLIETFSLQHNLGTIQCSLSDNSSRCVPFEGPYYYDLTLLQFPNYTVDPTCCDIDVASFPLISGTATEQRLNDLRLRDRVRDIVNTWSDNGAFSCSNGNCTFYGALDPVNDSSDLISFVLIIIFFCCWVQWSLHLTELVKAATVKGCAGDETKAEALAAFDNLLRSFAIIIIDVIWYVAWDKIATLTAEIDFYDDAFEDLLSAETVILYCRGIEHVTLIIGIFLTMLILSLSDLITVKNEEKKWLDKKINSLKQKANTFLKVIQVFFKDHSGQPRVQLTIRWLLEVLLLNAVYISVPARLGKGIKKVIGFGSACTIAFITGRDGGLLMSNFNLTREQKIAVFTVKLLFLVHAALFLMFPMFAASVTLLDKHAVAVSLSLSVQIYSIGKLMW